MGSTVRVYTTTWCSDCYRAKWFLKENRVPFEEINIEDVAGAEELVLRANGGRRRVPTFEIDDRMFHCSPYDPSRLARELGLTQPVNR